MYTSFALTESDEGKWLYAEPAGGGRLRLYVDAIGRTLFQGQVTVVAPSQGAVRVWRGAQVTEMACGASCSPSVRAGSAAPAANP